MQIFSDVVQGSEEWKQLRLGMVTASEFSIVTAKGRGGGVSKQLMPHIFKLISEKWTGVPVEHYRNEFMEWGNEHEDEARAQYELRHPFITIEQVGFIKYNDYIGGSPDGLASDVPEGGGLEIKCPASHIQLNRFYIDSLPPEYAKQVYGNMWICEADWWDFVSYDPRLPYAGYFEIRVPRDEKIIEELKSGVEAFVGEMLRVEERLRGDNELLNRQLDKAGSSVCGI